MLLAKIDIFGNDKNNRWSRGDIVSDRNYNFRGTSKLSGINFGDSSILKNFAGINFRERNI